MGHIDVQDLVNRIVLFLLPLLVSLSLHEYGHAATAVALGDQTPREQGRLTINPVVHIDLLGSLIVPITMIALHWPPIAWAKPVNFTPYRFTRKVHLRTAVMLTSAAGPAVNLVLAVLFALTTAAGEHFGHFPGGPRTLLIAREATELNVLLFVFNLIPLPPFDGARVVGGVMPRVLRAPWLQLERFAPAFIIVALLWAGPVLAKPTYALSDALYAFAHRVFP